MLKKKINFIVYLFILSAFFITFGTILGLWSTILAHFWGSGPPFWHHFGTLGAFWGRAFPDRP